MIIPLVLLTFSLLFALSYLQAPPEELIVGLWKHNKDDVFFSFLKDGNMSFEIPVANGAYGITGKYMLIDENLLKIELDYQYGTISGEPIFTNPLVLKVTIHVNEIIFHDLKINESEEQNFIRIK
jgi:hypothetical protein